MNELHHVGIVVRDARRSAEFYEQVLGLSRIARPPFSFDGAWFLLPSGQHLHLIENPKGTFRNPSRGLDPRDCHFALRVADFEVVVASLRGKGCELIVNRTSIAGFPQLYLLDPDANVIEINAAAHRPAAGNAKPPPSG